MKKLFSLLLAIVMIFTVSTCCVIPAQAKSPLKYTMKIADNTAQYRYGKIELYCKYPAFKGSKASVKRINKSLRTFAKKRANRTDPSEYVENLKNAYEYNYEPVTFEDTLKGKVMMNNGRIVSVRFQGSWYMGGVFDGTYTGRTYSVKTGKRLKLSKVVKKKYNPTTKKGYKRLRRLIYNKLVKKADADTAYWFKKEYNTRKKLNNAPFYVAKNGKVVFCYNCGGFYDCIRMTLPSKYA